MSLVCDKHKQLVGESGKREYYSRTDQMVGWFSLTAKATRSPLHFVTLVGFGTFNVKERAARTGRNPQTGATIEIAAGKVPAFKAGKALKDAVN